MRSVCLYRLLRLLRLALLAVLATSRQVPNKKAQLQRPSSHRIYPLTPVYRPISGAQPLQSRFSVGDFPERLHFIQLQIVSDCYESPKPPHDPRECELTCKNSKKIVKIRTPRKPRDNVNVIKLNRHSLDLDEKSRRILTKDFRSEFKPPWRSQSARNDFVVRFENKMNGFFGGKWSFIAARATITQSASM